MVNSLLAGALLTLILAVVALCWSDLRMGYGRIMASSGNYEKAQQIAAVSEKDGVSAERVASLRIKTAKGLMDEKRYDEALSALSLLPAGNAEAQTLTQKARLLNAQALYDERKYEEASRIFYLVSDTEEGAGGYTDCLIAMAIQAYQAGNENAAHQLLMSADNPDERIGRVAIEVTGSSSAASQILASDTFNTESLAHMKAAMQAVLAAKDTLPNGKIAAGNKHTVGLKADGTVVACGDDWYGQTEVTGWTNIKQVAAGAWHTVGLRADGTVVGCGDNSEGQLNVSGWTDIVMIAASDYDTIGLKSDGTVISCGMHAYPDLSGWHGVTLVSAGSYSAGCLYDQGMMRSTHNGAQLASTALLSDLSVCGSYSAGVLFDGTLISSFEGAPAWSDLVRVTASNTALFAISNTGEVKSHFFRSGDRVTVSVSGKAVEIASSGTHHVVLTEDGRVYAFGANDAGQLNVSGWQL